MVYRRGHIRGGARDALVFGAWVRAKVEDVRTGHSDSADEHSRFIDETGRCYTSIGEIGRGVLTTVAMAEAVTVPASRECVAIKTVLPLWIGHPLAEARISRERELSALLHADGEVFDNARIVAGGQQRFADGRSRPFHVSAFLHGTSLSERMKASRVASLSVRSALRWTDDVLRALCRLHRCGWVHRDVKPQNIFLEKNEDGDPCATLIDYGLAVRIGSEGHEQDGDEPFGTPAYVSPEVIACATLDARADLYSVGLVLFELLCGVRPFPGRDPIALLEAHLAEPAPSVKMHKPELSSQLEGLINATLAKSPGDRPDSAEMFRSQLARCPEGQHLLS